MKNPIKRWDNLHIKTYQVESYFPFQCKLYPFNGYFRWTGPLWNEKVVIIANGEICWSANTLNFENNNNNKDIQIMI